MNNKIWDNLFAFYSYFLDSYYWRKTLHDKERQQAGYLKWFENNELQPAKKT